MSERRYDDEQRWRDAHSVLVGQPTDAAVERRQASRRNRITIFVLTMVVAVVIGLVVGVITAAHGTHHETEHVSSSLVERVVGSLLLVSGLIIGVWGAVRIVRAGMWGAAWRSPLLNLTRSERREMMRRIRRNESVAADRHDLAADLATRLTQQRRLLLLYAGIVLSFAAGLIVDGSHQGWAAWTRLPAIVLVLLSGVLIVRNARRAQVWLDTHHDGAPHQRASDA